jgi:hypothetical protein
VLRSSQEVSPREDGARRGQKAHRPGEGHQRSEGDVAAEVGVDHLPREQRPRGHERLQVGDDLRQRDAEVVQGLAELLHRQLRQGVRGAAHDEDAEGEQGGEERRRERGEERGDRRDDHDLEQGERARADDHLALVRGTRGEHEAHGAQPEGPGDGAERPQLRITKGGQDQQQDRADGRARWHGWRRLAEGRDEQQHEARVREDEHREREQRAEVLPDEVLGARDGAREDGEDRLLFELAMEGGGADDDGHRHREDGDRRGAEIGDHPRRAVEREAGDDDRVDRDGEGDPGEPDQDARAHRLPVRVQRDDPDPADHGAAEDTTRVAPEFRSRSTFST